MEAYIETDLEIGRSKVSMSDKYDSDRSVKVEVLKVGGQYLWYRKRKGKISVVSQVVTILAYANCPAFMIVRDESGRTIPNCPRDELRAIS